MRKTSTLKHDPYTVIIPKMLYDDFIVAAGYLLKIVAPALEGVSSAESILDADLGGMISKVMVSVSPEDLPKISRALMVGTTIMGPDPLAGNQMCADLSPASRGEVFGENPMLPIEIIKEVVKLNAGFLQAAFPKLKGMLSAMKTSQGSSENSMSSAGSSSGESTQP